ncbi:hypothetical protein GCM10009850_028230 [Nonomuraea monospora]|uniref:Tox-PL domain-containing protein n=1 Tax=Nonomuraea monospora TaxID=568818 RepID=A0ABN3CDT0_9ACTN
MTLAPRVHQDQVARLVLHEISDVIQRQLDTTHTHTPGQTTRDECLTARHNELRYLQRKQQTAHAAGDTHLAQQLAQDIAAVQNDIDRRTRPSPSIHDVINWDAVQSPAPGVEGEPEPVEANLFKVTLSDGSPALLLEHSTRRERDLFLLMARLAGRLGLITNARADGDTNILIDWAPADASAPFLGTREAVLTGYLIAIADITPFVTVPAFHLHPSSTPLLELFLREGTSGKREWLSNPLSPSDVQTLRAMLEDFRASFAELGLLAQFDQIMARHEALAGGPLAVNAIGAQSVVAAAPKQLLRLGGIGRLTALNEHLLPTLEVTGPPPGGRLINAAHRLRGNLRHGVLETRDMALGRVVTFSDGSQALQIPVVMAAQVLVRALVRQALGLAGPALHIDEHGNVWRTFGSDELRRSLTTGISQAVSGSGHTTEVIFGDGRRALRHEFPTRAAADEYEAALEEAHEAASGRPGSYRASPYVLYEELIEPAGPTAEAQGRLATRALYALLAHGRPMDLTTLRRLLDANPLLARFGQVSEQGFRVGAPVLSADDVAGLTARFATFRAAFDTLGLSRHHDQILNTLRSFTGSGDTGLIPLAFSEDPATPEYRVPAWQPPPGPVLADLLRNDHLVQLNARLAQAKALQWREIHRNLTDVISRADAELAERPSAEGYVYAWVRSTLIPRDIRPGEGFAADTLLDGVDSAEMLAENPRCERVTILASDYLPVGDLSGKPHHAVFRPGTYFTVTSMLHTDDGETHFILTQQPTRTREEPVVTPTIGLTPGLAHDLAREIESAVSGTRAGVRVRNGPGHDTRPEIRPVGGAFVVEGRYTEDGMMVGGRTLPVEAIAAMLLNSPDLPPDAAILLTGPHDGAAGFARDLARFTDRVVLVVDGPMETAPQGDLRAGNNRSPELRIFLPARTSGIVAARLRAWLGPALSDANRLPSTHPDVRVRDLHAVLSELRPRGIALLPQSPRMTEEEHILMHDAYQEICRILAATGGRALDLDVMRELLPHVNPLRANHNCVEVALTIDDILSGRPAVAGPRAGVENGTAARIYHGRAHQVLPAQPTLSEVEAVILSNPGSRGILMGRRVNTIGYLRAADGHAYNIANVDGRLTYLDGQPGPTSPVERMSSSNMHADEFVSYYFYRTA